MPGGSVVVRILVAGALLAGPTALAFASGGFFDRPRTIAGIVAWAAVALLAATGTPPPRGRSAWIALGGLAGLTGWAAISISWAPLEEPARDDVGRLVTYTGALLASAMAWGRRADLRLVEPLLAGGALVVCLYGLSGRLLPDLIDLDESATGAGRLEQPLTYWNAMGALAALGLVLAIRVAGTGDRAPALRAAAAAAGAPLGMAMYLSFSRGAIAAFAVGVVVLFALRPTPAQLRAVAIATGAGLLAAITSSFLPAVESLAGGSAARDGALALAALAVLAGGAAVLQLRSGGGESQPYVLPRRTVVGAVAAAILVGAPLAAVALDRGDTDTSATASRLDDLGSNRYDYWQVALDAWADEPLRGVGTAGFRVEWLRDREIDEPVRDAHSLYLETAAELGIVGVLLLALLIGGIASAGTAAARADRQAVAGSVAGLAVFATHAAIDWDWEMPALALPALVLAGVLLARAEAPTTQAGRSG